MTDFKYHYIYALVWLLALSFIYFHVYSSWYLLYLRLLGYTLLNLFKQVYTYLIIFRSQSTSLSLAPSLPPIPVASKNLSNGATAFSFASRSASHLFSA